MTRPSSGRTDGLERSLRRRGARVRLVPTTRIEDPPDLSAAREAVRALGGYDWLIFSSANGVERFARVLEEAGCAFPATGRPAIAAIGPATAEAVRARGGEGVLVAGAYHAGGLADAVLARMGPAAGGQRVLFPRALEGRDAAVDRLRAAGVEVDAVAVYATRVEEASRPELRRIVSSGAVDWITLAAGSAARAFVELAGRETGGARVAAIGPSTAAAARSVGLRVDAIAVEHTGEGLILAMERAETHPVPKAPRAPDAPPVPGTVPYPEQEGDPA